MLSVASASQTNTPVPKYWWRAIRFTDASGLPQERFKILF